MTLEVLFIDTKGDTPDEFAPRPVKDLLPEWWRTLSATWGEAESALDRRRLQTVKRCVPMLDMMTSGYMLVTPTDLHISEREGGTYHEWPDDEIVQIHATNQLGEHPSAHGRSGVPKWLNPWAIVTPKGYSCLFITPAHHPVPFRIFEGIVDTDRYNDAVTLPFTTAEGFSGTIPAGTPMAQVIPFRRDQFTHRLTTDDRPTALTKRLVFASFLGGYRDRFWSRKRFD